MYLIILLFNERRGCNEGKRKLRNSRKVIWRIQNRCWTALRKKLGKLQANNTRAFSCNKVSNIKEERKKRLHIKPWIIYSWKVLSSTFNELSSLFFCLAVLVLMWAVPLLAEILGIKGSGVPARMLCSVLSFHFFHPGHVPVPRRNRLQLHKRITFCAEWRVQGTERRGRWREV